MHKSSHFWATICETVRPMLSDCCPVCLSVMLVHCGQMVVFWPNGWMDQDATWYGGRPQPTPLLYGDPAPLPTERGTAFPYFFTIVAKRLNGSGYHFVRR